MKSKQLFALLLFQYLVCIPFIQAQQSKSASELQHQMEHLRPGIRVLYIAAHPDDENTRLISWLVNDQHVTTAYLSLTRGDGGQNLIGSEQGTDLGIIRTRELLAARAVDGAQQFFTRAFDFGYSKSPDETFSKWGHEAVLSDVVFLIRYFRPHVIITRFGTDGSGGHGHHTASAILAGEAFDAAADPNRFPEQLSMVQPWKTQRLLYNSTARFRDPNADMSGLIKQDVGGYNALLGKSYGEIAAASRSCHRSQGFGSASQRGELFEYFQPLKGDTANLQGILDRLNFLSETDVAKKLNRTIERAINGWKAGDLNACTMALIEAQELTITNDLLNIRQKGLLMQTILAVNGIFLETNLEGSPLLAIGDTAVIKLNAISRNCSKFKLTGYSALQSGASLKCNAGIIRKMPDTLLKVNKLYSDTLIFKSCKQTQLGNLSWLDLPVKNNLFQQEQHHLTYPWDQSATISVYADIELYGKPMQLWLPVNYKWVDPDRGERYRPIVLLPAATLTLNQPLLLIKDNQPTEVQLTVKANRKSVTGKINFQGKDYPFALERNGELRTLSLPVNTAALDNVKELPVGMEVNGENYPKAVCYREIAYDHIPVQPVITRAVIQVRHLNLKRNIMKIGYIEGAGDDVASCLKLAGYEVETITNEQLLNGDLSLYPAIVVGVRAYNVNEQLSALKQKLMTYVENGGNLIVQYNTNSFAGPFKGNIGPYTFRISRDRITNEEAKVNFESPEHPVLNTPNKITEKDFEGWVQERSIYHGGDIDPRYETPLSMADPGEANNKGALLIAPYGKGNFIYTGLSFFRQLPAGTPGAYRLFINLIELKRK